LNEKLDTSILRNKLDFTLKNNKNCFFFLKIFFSWAKSNPVQLLRRPAKPGIVFLLLGLSYL
jgi:hypothetical protein